VDVGMMVTNTRSKTPRPSKKKLEISLKML
jgi:hypothetical protein